MNEIKNKLSWHILFQIYLANKYFVAQHCFDLTIYNDRTEVHIIKTTNSSSNVYTHTNLSTYVSYFIEYGRAKNGQTTAWLVFVI